MIAGHRQPLVERALDVAAPAHGEGADDRRDDRDAAEHERVEHDRRGLVGVVRPEGQDAQQHHRDRGDGVGLEQVGRHAGAVADVVAHVVGDHRRVARIVLGDAGLDLAHEVGADVGRLGEDAAAETGEDRDQRAAEPEADERVDGLLLGLVEDRGEDAVVAGHADEREADDEQAGDGAAAEGGRRAPGATPPRADSATRALARTETFMPMKPAAAEGGRRWRSRSRPRCSAAGSAG